jgi:hypothetical protein
MNINIRELWSNPVGIKPNSHAQASTGAETVT